MMLEDWTQKCLVDVATYHTGRTPFRANEAFWADADDGVPWIAISDMTEFGVVTRTKEKITRQAFNSVFGGRAVRAGTLLMSFKLTIGRVATLGIDACHNEAIISIYPKPGTDQRFLGYFLSRVDYDALQDRQIKGNTLNKEKIDRIEIFIPSLVEQIQIANILDLIRRSIYTQERSIEVAIELKRAAMQALFTRGLRGEVQKTTEIGLMPRSWEVRQLGEISRLSTGTTPATKRADYYEGNVPFVRTAEIANNKILCTSTLISQEAVGDYSLKIYPKNTVLMAMYGQGKTRGQVSMLEIEAAITQNAAAIQTNHETHPYFTWHYLRSIYDKLRGMGSLGHLSHLNLGYLRKLPIVSPSYSEQVEIASILDGIDRKIDLHRRKLVILNDLFEALLHKLMTREIRVSELDLTALSLAAPADAAA